MRAVYLLVALQLSWVVGIEIASAALRKETNTTTPEVFLKAEDRGEEDEAAITTAIATANTVVEAIKDVMTTDGLQKFGEIAGKWAPLLGVGAALLSAILPDSTSIALNQIQSKLEEIEGQLTSLSHKMTDLKYEVKMQHAITRIRPDETKLMVAEYVYDAYINASSKIQKRNYRDVLISLHADSSLLFLPIVSLYMNVNQVGTSASGSSLAEQLYQASYGNWNHIQSIYVHLQTLIIKGIATYTLGCELSGKKGCKGLAKSTMGWNEEYHTTFNNNFMAALARCKSHLLINRRNDVLRLLHNNPKVGNTEMANIIAAYVRKKYFWKDQTVIVYSRTISGTNHGHKNNKYSFFFNQEGRTTVILDGDGEVPDPSNPSSSANTKVTISPNTAYSKTHPERNSPTGNANIYYTHDAGYVRRQLTAILPQLGYPNTKHAGNPNALS